MPLLKEHGPGEPEPVFLWGDVMDLGFRLRHGLPGVLDRGQVGYIHHFAVMYEHGSLNLVPQAHGFVYGLYCHLSDEHLQILDDLPGPDMGREGVVLYEREAVTVEPVEGDPSWAWTWFIRGTVPERLRDHVNWKPGDVSHHQHPGWEK
jgi:hypothetical protein